MKLLTLLAAMVTATLLGSCNTMIGMSRDIKILGTEMENSAHKAKNGGTDTTGGDDNSGAPIY